MIFVDFVLAVSLVIVGTYLLFASGSIAFLNPQMERNRTDQGNDHHRGKDADIGKARRILFHAVKHPRDGDKIAGLMEGDRFVMRQDKVRFSDYAEDYRLEIITAPEYDLPEKHSSVRPLPPKRSR